MGRKARLNSWRRQQGADAAWTPAAIVRQTLAALAADRDDEASAILAAAGRGELERAAAYLGVMLVSLTADKDALLRVAATVLPGDGQGDDGA